jgi:hypothetical protein
MRRGGVEAQLFNWQNENDVGGGGDSWWPVLVVPDLSQCSS